MMRLLTIGLVLLGVASSVSAQSPPSNDFRTNSASPTLTSNGVSGNEPIPGAPLNNLPPEPLPSYRIPVPAHGMTGTPPLPPYAWPTYAPYNNFSRVAYPTCYPYEAFPYFGPFYPFPKVPLGWRAVKLEWNDGFWFLSTHAQRYDYWVLRFW